MGKLVSVVTSKMFIGVVSLLVGALVILGIRFVTYHKESVHYHANFVVYINGQREEFKDSVYYSEEEASSCTTDEEMVPAERAHMHDEVNSVVHVEDHAVTWGQFFQNLTWVVDPKVIRTHTQLYTADDQHKITFILNGEETSNIVNRVIGDKDRLMVDFGNTSAADLQKEYNSVPTTAAHYDVTPDPKTCSGSRPTTFHDRLTHLF